MVCFGYCHYTPHFLLLASGSHPSLLSWSAFPFLLLDNSLGVSRGGDDILAPFLVDTLLIRHFSSVVGFVFATDRDRSSIESNEPGNGRDCSGDTRRKTGRTLSYRPPKHLDFLVPL